MLIFLVKSKKGIKMIYLKLFLTFLEIGVISFGGGYGMIALVKEIALENKWLTETEFVNFIAISESTPGPLAVNMATFIGSKQGGLLGSFASTLGVILPSFIIILIIVAFINNLLKYKCVNSILKSIQPAVIALIIGTSITMFLSIIIGYTNYNSIGKIDFKGLLIFTLIALISFIYQKWRKKKISPIGLIIVSAILGIVFYI